MSNERKTEGRDELRRVLLPPLRFAARDNYARIERLKGLPGLIEHCINTLNLDANTTTTLRGISGGYDDATAQSRRERIARLEAFLEGATPGADGDEPKKEPSQDKALSGVAPKTATEKTRSPDASGTRQAAVSTPPSKTRPNASDSARDYEQDDGTDSRARPPTSRRPKVAPGALQRAGRAEALDVLDNGIERLRGIGPARASALHARGLHTVGDLLTVLPRAYQDRRHALRLDELIPGAQVVASGDVVLAGAIGKGRGGRFEVVLEDGSGRLKLLFFHFRTWDMKRRFAPGQRVTVSGEVSQRGGSLQMVHPRVVQGESQEKLTGIWPVYPELSGLHPAELQRGISAALDAVRKSPPAEVLPAHVIAKANIISIEQALLDIHAPAEDCTEEELTELVERNAPAFRRLAFEELFVLQLAMGLRRRASLGEPAPPLAGTDAEALAEELLPFQPTGAQLRCTTEILADMDRPEPMGRLLQGDVGAGKTAVAALACLRAVRAGYQAAVMAPTEILAEQHQATFEKLMRPLGIRVAFFSGSLRGKARRLATAKLKNHEIDIAVGTQALLSDDVQFCRLGISVIDEQHRFGVVQRATIKQKGPTAQDGTHLAPHLLVMTATPIPRSLALTVHGDLAVSVVDEMPPGRTPVKTSVLMGDDDEFAWVAVREALGRQERAYVVYPLIEESEKMDLLDATRGFEDLSERFGKERVGLLHGKMPAEEKERIMGKFSRGELSVLVSTTVIEVGVDVPEATCMVVMHAERFGLSQLHQLRGRVGRSDKLSQCFLVVGGDGASKDAKRRLAVLEESNDGFRIAEEDLAIRGPGDFLGTRQSGLPTLLFADITRHGRLIENARQLANDLLDADPQLQAPAHRGLRVLVERRFSERIALAAAG